MGGKSFSNRRKSSYFILFILIFNIISIFLFSELNINIKNYGELMHDPDLVIHSSSSGPPNRHFFKYYKTITIDHNQVSGTEDHKNFPGLISIFDSDLHDQNKVRGDGYDIAFANDTAWLDHEIELFDQSYNATHAKLVAWVRIPRLSINTDTIISMYYGNSTMVPRENPEGVWDGNYYAVYHMNQDPSSTSVLDSTANNYDLDSGPGFTSGNLIDGAIGKAIEFNRQIDEYLNISSGFSNPTSSISLEMWFKPQRLNSFQRYFTAVSGYYPEDIVFNYNTTNNFLRTRIKNSLGEETIGKSNFNGWDLNQFYHFVWTWEGEPVGRNIHYLNGAIDSYETDADPLGNASQWSGFFIGTDLDNSDPSDVIIEEFRITSSVRSPGWFETEYNNQYDPSSFYTVANEILVDTTPPDIKINSPNSYEFFSTSPPIFNVEINDNSDIDKMWYRLSNGTITTINTTFTGNNTISQTRWNEMGNGTVTIQFFSNDSQGNIGFSEVIVRKDIHKPTIIINTPSNFELFGTTAPDFNVEIYDINGVDEMWYTLNNGPNTFFTINGTISSIVWSNCGNGTVSIKFYANDSVSNIGFSEVIVRKEVNSPSIEINSPNPYECFGKIAPDFNILIKDNYTIDKMWYTLNNGIETYFTTNGTIPQSAWNAWGNGTISIKFYANNSLGNGAFEEVIVRKDVINPIITINNPDDYDIYGKTAPLYNVEIIDINGIDTMWYTLDGGNTNTTFISNGYINQDRWSDLGSGIILIVFYANDTLGNVGSSDVYVDKDIDSPNITINSPTPYQLCGAEAPSFNIEISDKSSISLRSYSLNNGVNITFSSNTTINQAIWELQANGTVNIKFYATDSLGNEGFSEVIVRKDIDPPEIFINNPFSDQVFGANAPVFNVQITDINGVDTMWYSLDGGLTNTIFTTNGSINQGIWDDLGDGYISLQFYANNSIGTIGYSEVSIIKDMYAPKITINSLNDNLYCKDAPIINLYAFDVNFDKLWCEIGNDTIFLTNNIDFEINSSIWEDLPEGSFQIFIYANDTLGHLNDTIILDFSKDTTIPNAPILTTYPIGEVSLPIIFDWEEVSDASGIAYYRLIIDNEEDPLTTPGFTFEIILPNNGSESSYYELLEYIVPRNYFFFIYQIDMAGNQGSAASGTFTIEGSSGPVTEFPWWIILILLASAITFATALVLVRRRLKKKITPTREKIPYKIISSHINQLSSPKLILHEEKIQKVSEEEETAVKIDEIKSLGEELFTEGAYLEAQKQFIRGRDLLISLGRDEEAKLFSELISGIEGLIQEREKRLEILEELKLEGNSVQVFETYHEIIAISKKLQDLDTASYYHSELIQFFQTNKSKLTDLEEYRSFLEQEADSLLNDNQFEDAAQLYRKCEKLSQLFIQLERDGEVGNFEKYKNKKAECLNRAKEKKF
ncbi:MAG: DUF2341 domain-containing protein [Candidatus Thorarchaeota archaeon]